MSELKIEVVESRRQWNDFFSLRRKLYQHDPAAVIPLRRMEQQQVDRQNNPFYQHARIEAFVGYREGEPVGRIAAIVDDLHQQLYQDGMGFFGFFESIDDQAVVDRLLDTATQWLIQQGCRSMRGPVNPSMKSDFGVVVEGNQVPPTIMLPHTPERYDRHLLAAGFEVAKSFHAFHVVLSRQAELVREKMQEADLASQRILSRYPQLDLRPVSAENYAQTLREINELGNRVRSESWGFVPLTTAELEFMIKNLRPVIRYDMIHVAYWEDRLIGYIVNIPDLNWALKRTWGKADWIRMLQLPLLLRRSPRTRVIALGVDPDFRNKGAAILLIKQLTDRREAFDEWDFSWVQEDNVKSIRAISRAMPLNQYKTFRLYQRACL
jgi:GNAT superfamily N-acetyltransferase